MKEVTYEDWQKNPTPRMMWVWDSKVEDKVKRKVIYFIEDKHAHYPIVALCENGLTAISFQHCAEIEEPKTRRMTNKELSRWLREKPTREWKCNDGNVVYSYYGYEEKRENEEVPNNIIIREDDGEWREPLVEVEE